MVEAKSAAFGFKSFKIPHFSYNESEDPEALVKLDFKPSGKYREKEGIFELQLELSGFEDSETANQIIHLVCVADFEFEEELLLSEIPDYFYTNAIAIVFPYIRSFISTLTLQANSPLLILGLMNLTNLEVPLRKNTISE